MAASTYTGYLRELHRLQHVRMMFNRPRNSAKESLCSIVEDNIELIKYSYVSSDRFTLHNFCLKLSRATCLQLELYCVNQAYNSPTLS